MVKVIASASVLGSFHTHTINLLRSSGQAKPTHRGLWIGGRVHQDPSSHVCPCSPHTLWVVDVEVSELGDVSRGPSGVSAFPRRIKHLEDK